MLLLLLWERNEKTFWVEEMEEMTDEAFEKYMLEIESEKNKVLVICLFSVVLLLIIFWWFGL